MPTSFGKNLVIVLLCSVFLGALGTFCTLLSTDRLKEVAERTSRLHQRFDQADDLARDLERAEDCRCGFVMTGEAAHQTAYSELTDRIGRRMKDALQFAAHCPSHLRRLETLEGLARRQLDILGRSIALRHSQRFNVKGQLALTRQYREAAESFRQALAEYKEAGTRRLAQWDAKSRNIARDALGAMGGGGAGILALCGLTLFTMRRDVKRHREEDQSRLARTESAARHQDTRCRSLDEQARRTQQLASLGRLACGVAHDCNNFLTVMMGCGQLALRSLPNDDPSRELIGQLLRAGEKAAALTRQVLNFSRRSTASRSPLNLNEVVTGIAGMARHLVGADVEVGLNLDSALKPIRADKGQMEQVLLNLIANARDAMPQGGRLLIETHNVKMVDERGPRVLLAVADSGCGMDEATRARIFEPFFTTKEEGRGTGLGMAIVLEAVQAAGGELAVESALGRGTTIKLYLPVVREEPPAEAPGLTEVRRPTDRPARQTVLLVDRPGAVSGPFLVLLRQLGYTVLTADSGQQAVRAAAAHAEPVHLLIANLALPDISGPGLLATLAETYPDVKVLYLSEPGLPPGVRLDEVPPGSRCLPKPFTIDTLDQMVREVLGS